MKYPFAIILSILIAFIFFGCKKDAPTTAPPTGNNLQTPSVSLLWSMGNAVLTPQTGPTGFGIINMQARAIATNGHTITHIKILLSVDSAAPIVFLDSTLVPVESFLKLYKDINVRYINGNNLLYTAIATQEDGKTDSATLLLRKPKVTFAWNNGAGYSSADGTVKRGDVISFNYTGKASEGIFISQYKISSQVQSPFRVSTIDSNALPTSSFSKQVLYIPVGKLSGSKLTFTASVTEQSNGFAITEVPITLTVSGPPASTIQTFKAITLGAQSNTAYGAFFNPTIGASGVTNLIQSNQDPTNVHIVYYSNNTHKETFSSPTDAQVTQIFPSISYWKVKNSTQFRKTSLTAADFDNISTNSGAQIDNQFLSGTFSTKLTQLKVGDVVGYINQYYSHYALLKITAINAGAAGTITFDMKCPVL